MKFVLFAILIIIVNVFKMLCSHIKHSPKEIIDQLRNSSHCSNEDNGNSNSNDVITLRSQAETEEEKIPHFFSSINFIPLDKPRPFAFFNNLASKMKQNYSELLLYPYTIHHSNGTASNGGIFDINKSTSPPTVPNWFLTNVSFSIAKPLYLINIGIVSKKTTTADDKETELFYEDSNYCNYFSTYYFLYNRCYRYHSEYDEFKAKETIEHFLIYLDEGSLVNLLLKEDGSNLIDLLVIPDYYFGKDDEAKAYFTPKVIEVINAFLENRGTLVVSGKSSILLEYAGFIELNTYNTTLQLRSAKKDFNVTLNQCDNVLFDPPLQASIETEASIHKNIICIGRNLDINGITISSYIMNKEHINDFETLISYTKFKEEMRYVAKDDGKISPIEPDAIETPYLVTKAVKNGRLFIFNSNPIFRFYQGPLFQNVFFYSSIKEANLLATLIMSDSNPIPSGETNVELRVDLNFTNYSPDDLSADLHVFLPKYYMMYTDYDKNACGPSTHPIHKDDFDIEKNNLNASSHLLCHYDSVKPNHLIYLIFKIGFSSISTNEFATNINVMQPLAYYTNKRFPLGKQVIKPPVIKAKTAKAALLKGTVDCSGSSFYPLPGRGKEQKNTIKILNKYTTEAKSIEYIDVIPLITPIIDGNGFSLMGRAMSFMNEYYQQKGFKVPFNIIGDSDYLDTAYLNNRNVRLVPDYDQPVRVEKETRMTNKHGPVDVIGDNKKLSIGNINYSTMIDNPNTILNQIFIGKGNNNPDASQRLMCFVDDPSKTAQREILFARIDIHFNNSMGYKPLGISNKHAISIDEDKSKEIKWGSFNERGLVPTRFVNTLLLQDGIVVLNGTNREEMKKVTNDIRLTHYLLPVLSKDIDSVEQLKDFSPSPEADGSGYHNDYPCIKFIKAHSVSFTFKVQNQNCQGGKLIIHFPKDVNITSSDPIKESMISFASDKLAFTNTKYDKGQNAIETFFKSGLLALENSNVVINIESLSLHESFTVEVETFEMKYDLSIKSNNHEVYTNVFNYSIEAVYSNFFSLPAVEMHIFTKSILGNQLKSPFTEYSLYIQELNHRTVYGSMKSNHVTEPGTQLMSSGFSLITKIGATTEHLINYIAGKSSAIPSSSSSSRIEWVDMWNRNWAQPIGTLFTSNPSDGNSKFNDRFSVATTFEITKNNGKTRLLQWRTEDEVELRVKIKLSNHYNKYFEPTICKNNQVPFKTGAYPSNNRVYNDAPSDLEYTALDDQTHLILGHSVDYGKCYMSPLAVMTGKAVTQSDFTELATVSLCSPYTDIETFEQCIANMDSRMKVSAVGSNYSPDVEAYYPKGYITPEMWNMKVKEYEDNCVFKGYKYHHDNNLPSIDQDIDVPQNIIGFPLLKPIDYSIFYDKSLSLATFPNHKGWWSDNLQNKDDTLLAGQLNSYLISEGQSSPLTEDKWIHYSKLNSDTASSKSNNEYMCLFNQHRIKTTAKQSTYPYATNVLQNNIVPIIQKSRSDINCVDVPQYSEQNISQYDNRVVTQSDVDWIYFASNIRAQAKETINIVLKLKGINYIEGIFKILDGIEFNYWNPLSEPDTFAKITTDSIVIEGANSGIEIETESYPRLCEVAPICTYILIMTIKDKGLDFREYEFDAYHNSYGFGDVGTGVVVGGINGTKCKVYPGDITYIDISITNNAGYDFNILKNGIEYPDSDQGSNLLKEDMPNIQNPTKINIFSFNIPSALKDYIVIEPSHHLGELTHQEMAFNHYNPTTIKDGTKAHYFFKITIKETFSDKEKAMMKEIPVSLNTEYFDHIIGKDDPLASIHDYTISIPSIKFGVPHSTTQYADQIYHLFEYNTGLYFSFLLDGFNVAQLGVFNNETLIHFLKSESLVYKYDINTFTMWYDSKIATTRPIRYTCSRVIDPNNRYGYFVECHFEKSISSFPMKQTNGLPDMSKLFMWLAYSLPYSLGTYNVFKPFKFTYFDYLGQNRTVPVPAAQGIKVTGPMIKLRSNHTLVSIKKEGQIFEYNDGMLYATDSGVIRLSLFYENIGDAFAYDIYTVIVFGTPIKIIKNITDPVINYLHYVMTGSTTTNVTVITNKTLPVGEAFHLEVEIGFEPLIRKRQLESESEAEDSIETERVIIDSVSVGLVFQNVPEKPNVTYDLNERYVIKYPEEGKAKRREIYVNITNVGSFENPKINIRPETKYFKYEEEDYSFVLFRRIISSEIGETVWEKVGQKETNDTFEDEPLTNSTSDYEIEYRVEAYVIQSGHFVAGGVNSHAIKKKLSSEVIENDSNLGLIMVISLSTLLILFFVVIIIAVVYRLSRKKKGKEANTQSKVPIPHDNSEKSVPIETIEVKKSVFNTNNNNFDTDSDMSPTKFKNEPNPTFIKPGFIRIKRRNSTHGTRLSIQNFINEQD